VHIVTEYAGIISQKSREPGQEDNNPGKKKKRKGRWPAERRIQLNSPSTQISETKKQGRTGKRNQEQNSKNTDQKIRDGEDKCL
jgi:hypothetical protein